MDILTRTAKKYYEELFLQGGKQIFSTLFPTNDESTDSAFSLDTLIAEPYGIAYRDRDTQSALRPYDPGVGQVIDVPRASEKTPISESLLDKVAVGVNETAGFGANEAKIVGDIVRQHIAAHNMTKNKQALDVIESGVFTAKGVGGVDLGLSIDFARKSSLNMTYDFTANGATFSEAITNQQEELRANGTPLSNLVMMLGQNWLSAYSEDEEAQRFAQNNALNQLVVNPMTPQLLSGTQGLYVVGQLRSKKMLAPVWLTSYSPGISYRAHKGASPVDFMPANKAFMFSMDDTRWHVKRGILVKDDSGRVNRVVGDLVLDKFSDNDPVTTFLRSATRHVFIPANINHTSASTGTFE